MNQRIVKALALDVLLSLALIAPVCGALFLGLRWAVNRPRANPPASVVYDSTEPLELCPCPCVESPADELIITDGEVKP